MYAKHRILSAVLVGVFSIGSLALAVPRFIASVYALYPESVLPHIDEKLPADTYIKSVNYLNNALRWDNNPDYWQALALFKLALVSIPNTPFVQQFTLLSEAKDAIKLGLKGSPIDGIAWFRYAVVCKSLGQPASPITESLRLSLYAARVEPDLVMPRLRMAYYYMDLLNSEEQILWLKQVPVALQFNPLELVSFVIDTPKSMSWVESAFGNDVAQLTKFKQLYDKALKKPISTKLH